MTPEEKQTAVDIVTQSDEPWGVQCTQLLRDTCKVTLSMLPQLHTCIILASEDPSHIMRGIPQDEADDTSRTKRVVDQEEAAAEEMRKKADFGLNMLMRCPQNLSGISLFEHQVAFRQRAIAASDHKVSSYLNVEVVDKHQQALISPDAAKIIQHNIMQEVGASSKGSLGVPGGKALEVLGHPDRCPDVGVRRAPSSPPANKVAQVSGHAQGGQPACAA